MKNYYLLLCCLLSIQSFGFNTDGKLLFCARMYGSNEVPAVNTPAKGLATFLVQEDYMTVQVNAVFDSLSGAVTGCHIHTGAAGQNGGVAINLSTNVVGNRIQTQITFTKAQMAMAIDGGLYLNVHTAANPNGEIRAQLRLEKDNNYRAMLSGANQVPAVNTTAAGLGAFTLSYDQTKLDYKIVVNGLSGAIASAHLHFGAAGVAGGVAYGLTASGNVLSGSLSVNSAFLDSLRIGAVYVNVHTAANPNGEIRAQLSLQQGIQHVSFLEGAQEVPAVSTAATGLGIASIYSTLDTMSYAVLYTGVTPTSAHLHQGVMGMNGGVVFPLAPSPSVTNLYMGIVPGVTAIMVKAALQDGFYFNIHSSANPGGEIRGQVLSTVRESFVTSLCGSQQVPSVNTRAIGLGMMSINRMQDNAHIMFVNNGLSGNASAAHLHNAAAGATGGVLYDLSAMTGNAFFGYTAMTPANAMTVMMGNTYYNVHTAANANGEVRGQLGKSANQCSETTEMPNSDAKLLFASRLNGANQVPAVVTAAKGLATFMVQEDYKTVTINAVFDSLSGVVTGCHLHSGMMGQTGGVVIDLSPFVVGNRIQTTMMFTKAQLAMAIDNGLYLNVHTAMNPNGEIRAQLRLEKDNNFMALLSGANQVPAVSTTAAGLGAFTLSYSQTKLDYKIVVNGLSGDIASAHLHFGGAGVAGGVAYTLDAKGYNVLSGSLDVNPMFMDSLMAGKIYVNVHTAANPNGEIRAQLMPQRGIQHDAFLEGAQGTPFAATNAKGLGLVSINSTLDTLTYNVLYTGLTPTAAHIHIGNRGMSGGVLTTLATSPSVMNYYTGMAAVMPMDINVALKSGLYFNVHTAANPNGEIRGQIYPTVRESFVTSLCGSQQVPSVNTRAIGLGMMSINRMQDNAHIMFVNNGLSGNASAAHLHNAAAGATGGVLYDLSAMTGNAFFGYTAMTPANAMTVMMGNTYYNVHTAANAGGEVRGQLGKSANQCSETTEMPNSDARLLFASRLNGANQVPAVVTAAKGLATFMVQEDYTTVNVNAVFDSLSGAVTGCHIHSGAAGQTGGVLIDLSSFVRGNRIQTTLTFTKAQLAAAIDNGLYLNVHTAANPNGEIRAQLRLEKDNNYMALLSGANQVPAVSTTAAGLGAFTLSYSQTKLDYKIVVNGLSGDIASAHLHFGGAGVAGGVAYTLAAQGYNVLSGSLDVNAMFMDSLMAGKVYVNVHTAANPNGEIRAQLMPQRGIQHDAFLEGAQGTPFVATNAKGLGLVSINSTLDTLSYNVLYTGLTPTAAHIHTGTRGMAGGVVTGLTTSPTIQNYYTGTATGFTVANLNTALKSGWYFNIHTAANPNGEIRGQIYPTVREGLITSMCGAQEVPAVVAPSYGLGMMSINRNKDNAHVMFVVDKLTGNATSAHVHKGATGVAGGVLYPLTMVSNAFFGYINNLMMADVNTIVTGGTYFNVHTAMNPGGEVRGQLGKVATVCNIGTSVVNVNGAIFNVKTFPNPTLNDVTIAIESPKAFEATVSILDVMGRNVLTTLHQLSVGDNRLELPTTNLSTGIYFIQIKNNVELIVTQKIVKE